MRKLTLKVDNPLFEQGNAKYGYVFSDTNEIVITTNHYIDSAENLGFFTLKGKTLETRKVLVIPTFLQPVLFKVAREIENFVKTHSEEDVEKNKDYSVDVDIKKILKECDLDFDEACKMANEDGNAIKQEVVNKYINCRTFDRLPLDKTLKLAGFTKVYSDKNYRVKKEYSIHVGLDYSISISYIRYMVMDKDKVILNFNTYSYPYQVFTNLDNILK